jgi:hypothetical protein
MGWSYYITHVLVAWRRCPDGHMTLHHYFQVEYLQSLQGAHYHFGQFDDSLFFQPHSYDLQSNRRSNAFFGII